MLLLAQWLTIVLGSIRPFTRLQTQRVEPSFSGFVEDQQR